ncbi:hypothetical protein PMZ80_001959 [Knufia obscura]|uniref:Hydro-lyase n=2 Tax=Knufia TaxID=430999 RepID=A0AAN8I488_9EURO|nr:hypothetical protein PMZ80_001959 [Knufia obscura]KAK5953777.1 hypothetical protein OHC33_005046 [Knufia fluminis]
MATATLTERAARKHGTVQVAQGACLPAAEDHGHGILHSTGLSVRLASRSGDLTSPTAGFAPGSIQANLIVLPSKYAFDFRNLCARNPVPCPLLAESSAPGRFDSFKSYIPGVPDHELFLISEDGSPAIDIRTDIPRYNIYRSGKLVESGCTDIREHWDKDDSVAFLIGCSFSFETALAEAGLTPRHVERGMNATMYRTNIPLCPAGVFRNSTYVVSMRPYKEKDIEAVRNITRAFGMTHGEPIDWGWDAVDRLGIRDIDVVQWGDGPVTVDGKKFGKARAGAMLDGAGKDDDEEVPVFWGCGVTPQEAVMRAGDRIEGTVIGHMPGHMLLLDVRDEKTRKQT